VEYVKELRKLVGNRPLIVCACGCLVFNKKGQVLLQKRDDDNLWGNPGGSVNVGETVHDTVKREMSEETGLEVSGLEIFNIYSGEEQHHIYPNGDEAYFVNIIFKTTKYEGILRSVDGESRELRFFDLKDIPENVTKPFICVSRDLKRLR
jgi:ADP-ribose pyrophosphatase YjhB (NUDIX family)